MNFHSNDLAFIAANVAWLFICLASLIALSKVWLKQVRGRIVAFSVPATVLYFMTWPTAMLLTFDKSSMFPTGHGSITGLWQPIIIYIMFSMLAQGLAVPAVIVLGFCWIVVVIRQPWRKPWMDILAATTLLVAGWTITGLFWGELIDKSD